jgi:hypothetical protein
VTDDHRAAAGLEAGLDALFSAPLDEFTAKRDALAKALRAAGAAQESQRVKALRKPTAVAWAINRLHLERRGLAEIENASGALRAALRDPRSTEDRRSAIESRRRALERATAATVAILEEAGSSVSPALLRRIERTLLALATGTSAGGQDAPIPGRLTQELEPPGFEAILDAPAPVARPAPSAAGATVAKAAARPATKSHPSAKQPTATPSSRKTASAQHAQGTVAKAPPPPPPKSTSKSHALPGIGIARDSREARAAQAALDRAEGDLERATDKVEATRMKVTDAEKALAAARQQVDAARRELAAARSRRDEARRELDRARRP